MICLEMYGWRASYGYGRLGSVCCAADMLRLGVSVSVWEGRGRVISFVRAVLFIASDCIDDASCGHVTRANPLSFPSRIMRADVRSTSVPSIRPRSSEICGHQSTMEHLRLDYNPQQSCIRTSRLFDLNYITHIQRFTD